MDFEYDLNIFPPRGGISGQTTLRPQTQTTNLLMNDLQLIKNRHPDFFTKQSLLGEDPGLRFDFMVEERLAKRMSSVDPDLDSSLFKSWITAARPNCKSLPIDIKKKEISDGIRNNKFTMIVGGTGSGKSTRVPQIILGQKIVAMEGSTCQIVCTQPRRVAAKSIAKRVAYEMGEELGESVGYVIRGDAVRCSKKAGTITYMTLGVLVRMLIADPALLSVSHVILDEIHERSLEQEMLLWFLKKLAHIRSDLKVIVMSATMDTTIYHKYLDYCNQITIQGSNFDVKTYYLDDMPQILGTHVSPVEMASEKSYFIVMKVVQHIMQKNDDNGAILIFVPGWRDMEELNNRFLGYNATCTNPSNHLKVRLLHSKVPLDDRKIFDSIKGPGRKVLISTTIAESSITVPDVSYVIDLGQTNVSAFYRQHKSSAVKPEFITKAAADQRRGRAGRVKEGTCYRLYTRDQYNAFPEFLHAEKGNQNVTSTILNVLCLGESVNIFETFINRPDPYHIQNELWILRNYHMVGPNNQLTLLGRRCNDLPSDPLIAKMMIFGSIFGCKEDVSTVAAGVTNQRLFPHPQGHRCTKKSRKMNREYRPPTRSELTRLLTKSQTSDALSIVGALQKFQDATDKKTFCDRYLLDQKSAEEVLTLKKTVLSEMDQLKGTPPRDMDLSCLQDIIGSSFLPNVAWVQPNQKFNKFFLPGWEGFYNAPRDSVLHCTSMNRGDVVSYNTYSGIPPKLFIEFLNKISAEALFIFNVREPIKICDGLWSVENIKISGPENYFEFLATLRTAFQTVLKRQLITPGDIDWEGPKGKILDIVIRLLSRK